MIAEERAKSHHVLADRLAEHLKVNGNGSATHTVSAPLQVDARAPTVSAVFAELSSKFPQLVDVLTEISEMSGLKSRSDLLRTYELWQKTGSERARKQLRRAGIVPLLGRARTTH